MLSKGGIDSAKRGKNISSFSSLCTESGSPRYASARNRVTLSPTDAIRLIAGGPSQITCNYHTIIPDTVACTIFNMLFVTFGGGLSAVRDPCTFSLALLCFRFHLSFTLSAAAQTQLFFFSFFSFSSLFFKCFFTLHRAPIIIASLLLPSSIRHLYALVHLQDSHYILLPKRQLDSKSRYACSIYRNRGASKNDASSDIGGTSWRDHLLISPMKVFALTETNVRGPSDPSNLSDFQKTCHI
jgi:hypothetical protein